MLEDTPSIARAAIRQYLQTYLPIAHYVQRLKAVGFQDEDFANGGSNRLVNTIVVWGNEETLGERIAAQFKVGATHVCILPLNPNGGLVPDERVLAALAPHKQPY